MLRTKDNKIVVEYNERGWFVDDTGKTFHVSDKLPHGYILKSDYDKQCKISFREQLTPALNLLQKAIITSDIKNADENLCKRVMASFANLSLIEEELEHD